MEKLKLKITIEIPDEKVKQFFGWLMTGCRVLSVDEKFSVEVEND